jgi:hypothetical protein
VRKGRLACPAAPVRLYALRLPSPAGDDPSLKPSSAPRRGHSLMRPAASRRRYPCRVRRAPPLTGRCTRSRAGCAVAMLTLLRVPFLPGDAAVSHAGLQSIALCCPRESCSGTASVPRMLSIHNRGGIEVRRSSRRHLRIRLKLAQLKRRIRNGSRWMRRRPKRREGAEGNCIRESTTLRQLEREAIFAGRRAKWGRSVGSSGAPVRL